MAIKVAVLMLQRRETLSPIIIIAPLPPPPCLHQVATVERKSTSTQAVTSSWFNPLMDFKKPTTGHLALKQSQRAAESWGQQHLLFLPEHLRGDRGTFSFCPNTYVTQMPSRPLQTCSVLSTPARILEGMLPESLLSLKMSVLHAMPSRPLEAA